MYFDWSDNADGSSSATSQFFQMSGDGVDDVKIPVVFMYNVEGRAMLKSVKSNSNQLIYIGRRKLEGTYDSFTSWGDNSWYKRRKLKKRDNFPYKRG